MNEAGPATRSTLGDIKTGLALAAERYQSLQTAIQNQAVEVKGFRSEITDLLGRLADKAEANAKEFQQHLLDDERAQNEINRRLDRIDEQGKANAAALEKIASALEGMADATKQRDANAAAVAILSEDVKTLKAADDAGKVRKREALWGVAKWVVLALATLGIGALGMWLGIR